MTARLMLLLRAAVVGGVDAVSVTELVRSDRPRPVAPVSIDSSDDDSARGAQRSQRTTPERRVRPERTTPRAHDPARAHHAAGHLAGTEAHHARSGPVARPCAASRRG